jgi:hypothetical protein
MRIGTRNNHRRGEGLVIIIILLAIIGGGVWWLYNHKASLDRDARVFGREVIQKVAVDHDVQFFASNLSPQVRTNYPPSALNDMQARLNKMGVPQQPLNIKDQVTFESQFFEPKGFFEVQLLYPTGMATMQIAVSHPVSKWQIDDMTFTYPR